MQKIFKIRKPQLPSKTYSLELKSSYTESKAKTISNATKYQKQSEPYLNDGSAKQCVKQLRSSNYQTWKIGLNNYVDDENTTNEGCSTENKSENSTCCNVKLDHANVMYMKDPYNSEQKWKTKPRKLNKSTNTPANLRKNAKLLQNILLSAVHELYNDHLRPTFPELRRRLRKYNLSAAILKNLAEHYKQFSDEVTVDLQKQEVLLKNVDAGYVIDPKSPNDNFSCCEWTAFQEYVLMITRAGFVASNESAYTFEGGRYGMASKMLQDPLLQSEKLKSMSIGSLCHLIQLSIAYGIMQYENNILRPRANCLRIGAAYAQSDLNIYNATSSAFMGLEKVKSALKSILKDYSNAMLLSQLKLAFENKLSTRLCQSVFGYTRLSTLLQKSVFKSICRILIDNYSRIFIQSVDFPIPPNMTILNYDHTNTQFEMDEKAKRTMSVSFSDTRRCCCRPTPYLISYYSWQILSGQKVVDIEVQDEKIVDLGFDASKNMNEPISYPAVVHSIMVYLSI